MHIDLDPCHWKCNMLVVKYHVLPNCYNYRSAPLFRLFVKMSGMSRSHKVSFHARRTLSRPLLMSPSQSTSLLPPMENGIDQGEPSWVESYKWFFFSSYFNVLLVFVPLSVLAHQLSWDVSLRFSFSFLAIVPLAKVLSLTSK